MFNVCCVMFFFALLQHSTSPNVLAMIQTFNRIACIVCTEIVHERCLQTRGKAISKYITVRERERERERRSESVVC